MFIGDLVVVKWSLQICSLQISMYVYTKLKCVDFILCSEDSHAPGYHAVSCYALHDVEGGFEEWAGYV